MCTDIVEITPELQAQMDEMDSEDNFVKIEDITTDVVKSMFEFVGCSPSTDILTKCVELCFSYEIGAEDLVDTWVAFTLSNLSNAPPSIEGLGLMERKELVKTRILTSLKKEMKTKQATTAEPPKEAPVLIIPIQNPIIAGFAADDTLISKSPKCKTIPFEKRVDPGAVVLTGGPHTRYSPCTAPVKVTQFLDPDKCLTSEAKYMYTNLSSKANSLSRMAHLLGGTMMRHNNLIPTMQLKDKHMSSVNVYGRICCDADGKLNVKSTLLETPRRHNINGNTFEIDFSQLNQFSIFPGQVVGIKGNILNGTTLLAREIITSSFDKTQSIENLAEPIQIITAAGPFTIKNDILYEPLQELLNYVLQKKPHVLILMGPFLDEEHDNVQDGSLTESYESFFASLIESIMTPLADIDIRVVLVASHKDVHHQVIYPTPPYELTKNYPNLLCVPDPCLLNINGVIIGVTATDILFQIGRQELSWHLKGDRITRFATQVLDQLIFYPLYPPDPSMSVDHELLEKYGLMNVVPNVLILPSTLRYFVREIKGCTVINPERLVKAYTGGTFARFQITKRTDLEVSCEIIRI